jgi:uncharacterized protein YndB with AHSA1/START domain
MAAINKSIEISRPPGEVFRYATDFAQFSQWQQRVVSARQDGDKPLAVGTTAAVTRRAGPRQVLTTEEITALDPPTTWQVRGTGSIPVIAIATGTVTPLDAGSRSLVTITLDFEGHGVGKLLARLIARQSRRQLPKDQERLKELLEHRR